MSSFWLQFFVAADSCLSSSAVYLEDIGLQWHRSYQYHYAGNLEQLQSAAHKDQQ